MDDAFSAPLLMPLPSETRSAAVAQRLRDAITLGLIADGEQLPSELALASQLSVSTVTVREALARLRRDGLLDTRRGRRGGSFARMPRGAVRAELRRQLIAIASDELRDLADFRAAVSSRAAALAAERGSARDLARVRQRQAAVAAATDTVERQRADARFHIEIAATSQSTRLTNAEIALQAQLMRFLLLLDNHDEADDHEQLLEALVARDAIRAASIGKAHVARQHTRLVEFRMSLMRGAG